jgi:polysaccharide chain length determinant protein (PEP-CTERM system associated)
MQALIEDLLTQYTEKHPDVVIARKRLERLEKELEEEEKLAAKMNGDIADEAVGPGESPQPSGTKKNVIPNPIYEQVKLQLVQREAEIVTLKLRTENARKELEKWEKMAAHVPQVEQEMTRLNRDYQIIKTKYEEMRDRQESAKLARDMETKAQKVQFRIIDPPKVPIKPSSPNRPLFLAAVLALGTGAGLAFAFLLGQINTTFASASRLKSAFTLPVVGCVSAITSNRERRRRVRELLSFGLVSTSLLIAFGGLILIELLGARGVLDTVKTLVTI